MKTNESVEARSQSFSGVDRPELPPFNFSAQEPKFSSTDNIDSLHSRSHSNSVPNITYQYHDSVSSVYSGGSKTSFPYFDSSMPADYFELENSHDPPSSANSRRATDPSHSITNAEYGLHSAQYPPKPPSYAPDIEAPRYSEQDMTGAASDAMRSQIQGSFGTSVLSESLRLSTAQERRRRTRARFGMGTD